MSTKNLGQVAGLWIGSSAPENTSLIWYDNTPSIRAHKVYDFELGTWTLLDKNVISAITYTELKNLAQGTGLTQGSWYKLTDQGNILALAITSTKVQYVDVNNNLTIDDLASSLTYVVNSSNLLIDDIQGVWDDTNKKLEYSFSETSQDDNSGNDYIFGKKQRNNIWSLAKYKLSSLISSVSGNSITWNKGIFFNFSNAFKSKIDVTGGVVGKETYDKDKANLQQSINNVASSNQSILNSAKNYADSKVTSSEIYSKTLPTSPTTGTATDIAKGDTLTSIVTKIYRWINQLKYATGISISKGFTPATSQSDITNNDTVESALAKIQYWFNNIELELSPDWAPTIGNVDVEAGDNFQTAIAKLQGKFDYIYTNGLSISNDGKDSWIDSRGLGSNACNGSIYSSTSGVDHAVSIAGLGYGNKSRGLEVQSDDTYSRPFIAGVGGVASNSASNPCDTFGGYFDLAKILGLHLKARRVSVDNTLTRSDDIITCYNSASITLTLPPGSYCGKILFVYSVNNAAINIVTVDGKEIRTDGQSGSSVTIEGYSKVAILIYDGQLWNVIKI